MKRPIGVYDSGMGGLIVLESLIEAFPNEDFIYVADGGHFPYGTKTKEEIESYNLAIATYLEKQNAKAICIACNTATSYSSLLDNLISVPLIKAVEPNVKQIVDDLNPIHNNILVIATNLTIKSKIYEKALDQYLKDIPHQYYFQATQSFVNLVEENKTNTNQSFNEVKTVLAPYIDKRIDKIVLGCTHFPKLIPEIKAIFKDATIYHSGVAMAKELKKQLNDEENKNIGTITLMTTGDLNSFKENAKWFKYYERALIQKLDLPI